MTTSTEKSPSRRRRRRKNPNNGPTGGAKHDSKVDKPAPLDPDAPLSEGEIKSAQISLRFLAKNRKVLRLKVNAQEDLLLSGGRRPSERGPLKHLLAKIDQQTVSRALELCKDAPAKLKLLEGIIGFCTQPWAMLFYLEALAPQESGNTTSAKTSAGIIDGLRGLDFSTVSSAQLRRITELLGRVLSARERPTVLLHMLGIPAFSKLVAQTVSEGEENQPHHPWVEQDLAPLRAVYATIVRGAARPREHSAEEKARGLELLLRAAPSTLAAYPTDQATRLFYAAIECPQNLGFNIEHQGEALRSLLERLPLKDARRQSMALAWVRRLLRDGCDDEATTLCRREMTDRSQLSSVLRGLEEEQSEYCYGNSVILGKREHAPPIGRLLKAQHRLDGRPLWVTLFTHSADWQAQVNAWELLSKTHGAAIADYIEANPSKDELPASIAVSPAPIFEALPPPSGYHGQPLNLHLKRHRHSTLEALKWTREVGGIIDTLSAANLFVPDLMFRRFLFTSQGLSLFSLEKVVHSGTSESQAQGRKDNTEMLHRFAADLLRACKATSTQWSLECAAAQGGEAAWFKRLDELLWEKRLRAKK